MLHYMMINLESVLHYIMINLESVTTFTDLIILKLLISHLSVI